MTKKTYFITGGGTGGHIYPAIAVADAILESDDNNKVYYIGNPNNLEAKIVKDKNYTFLPVDSFGMPRKISLKFIIWISQMFLGWLKCCFYIIKYKPDIIFGTGGYVSAPILFAAITLKVPFVMHDCDANPGLVTRKLSAYANSISVAFEAACSKLNNKNCIVNGNPIRKDFSALTRTDALKLLNFDDKLTLCIMGGSQGAQKINLASVKILEKLTHELDLQVILQTGTKNYDSAIETLKEIYPQYENDKNLIVQPYFDNMAAVLNATDIAISRSGSLSISELCACSVAPIFIPYPYAAADHQRKNAKFMEEQGAGLYLEDEDTTPEKLFEMVESLINDKKRLDNIKNNAYKIAKLDATEKIVEQINHSLKN